MTDTFIDFAYSPIIDLNKNQRLKEPLKKIFKITGTRAIKADILNTKIIRKKI